MKRALIQQPPRLSASIPAEWCHSLPLAPHTNMRQYRKLFGTTSALCNFIDQYLASKLSQLNKQQVFVCDVLYIFVWTHTHRHTQFYLKASSGNNKQWAWIVCFVYLNLFGSVRLRAHIDIDIMHTVSQYTHFIGIILFD